MLNKPGTNEIPAIVRLSSRFEKTKIEITKPIVTPEPPNSPNICNHAIAKMCNSSLFASFVLENVSIFSNINGVNNASFTAANMLLP